MLQPEIRQHSRRPRWRKALDAALLGRGMPLFVLGLVASHIIALYAGEMPARPTLDEGRGYVLAMWEVAAAMIGIAFVALVLIVETIHRTVRSEHLWSTFFRSSRLLTITVLLLLLVISIGIDALLLSGTSRELNLADPENLVFLDTVFFILCVFALVLLYWDAFQILNPGYSLRLGASTLNTVIEQSLTAQIQERFAEIILREECEKNGLRYDQSSWRWEGLVPVSLKAEGVVTDVNLAKLRSLSMATTAAESNPKAVVTLCIGSTVSKDRMTALLVRREHELETRKLVGDCFRVGGRRAAPDRRSIGNAFRYLSEHGIEAIRVGRGEELDAVLENLLRAMERTLDSFEGYGIQFDATTVRQMFLFEWPVLDRPFREFVRLAEFCSTTSDRELLVDILYWPVKVMRMSVKHDDFLFFDQAVSYFATYLYLAGDASPRASALLRNKSWTHIKEFSSLELSARFREATDESKVASLEKYWKRSATAYAQILRHAIEAADADLLQEAAPGFRKMIDVQFLSHDLHVTIDRSQRSGFFGEPEGLEAQKARLLVSVADWKDAVWFSLGAWCCLLWANSELSPEQAAHAYGLLSEPFSDFRLIWRVFAAAMDAESNDSLPLSSWEISRLERETVHTMNSPYYLALFFACLALPTVAADTHEKIANLAEMKQASWVTGQVEQALTAMESDPERWKTLIGDTKDLNAQFDAIRRLLQAANSLEEEQERQAVIRQQVSPAKLSEFKSEFLVEWYSRGLMRRVFDAAGGVSYLHEEHPEKRVLSMSVILPKGAFVDDPGRTHWWGVAENFAQAFTRAENASIITEIRKAATTRRFTSERLEEKLSQALEDVGPAAGTPAIIIGYRWEDKQLVQQLPSFVPAWRLEGSHDPGLEGLLGDVPVYGYTEVELPGEVLIVDLTSVGRLLQYLDDGDSIFRRFEVQEYTEDRAREVASNADPAWLPEDARQLGEKELVEYLQEHVWVRIEESLQFEVRRPEAAIRLRLSRARKTREP